jgi:hypothetical protein
MFRQRVGIPMGTYCDSLIADLLMLVLFNITSSGLDLQVQENLDYLQFRYRLSICNYSHRMAFTFLLVCLARICIIVSACKIMYTKVTFICSNIPATPAYGVNISVTIF